MQCMCVLAAQLISPTVIAGQAGENVTINCTSVRPNEALNNQLMIYIPEQDIFVSVYSLTVAAG